MKDTVNIAKLRKEAKNTKDYFVIISALNSLDEVHDLQLDKYGNMSAKLLLEKTKGTDACDIIKELISNMSQVVKSKSSEKEMR